MKKGFTLIEIIIAIALISVISVGSFVGVKTIQKNIKADKLEDISDKIIEAVSVYIESNTEAKKQLYNNENGVLVPLNVLKNEGLIDFQDIEVDDKDYVVTMLGSKTPDSACIDTTTIGSWEDGNKTIYLCTDKNGNSNLTSIGFSGNNLSLTSKNRVWFYTNYLGENYGIEESAEAKTNNYVKYKDRVFKIYYIDRDDSLALLSYDSFGNLFDGKTQNIDYYERNIGCQKLSTGYGARSIELYSTTSTTSNGYFCGIISKKTTNGEATLDFLEMYDTGILYDNIITQLNVPSSSGSDVEYHRRLIYNYLKENVTSNIDLKYISDYIINPYWGTFGQNVLYFTNNDYYKKIHLKPCMKISGGNGDEVNPYILKDYC